MMRLFEGTTEEEEGVRSSRTSDVQSSDIQSELEPHLKTKALLLHRNGGVVVRV